MIVSYFYKRKGNATNKLRIAGQAIGYLSVLANIALFSYGLYKATVAK